MHTVYKLFVSFNGCMTSEVECDIHCTIKRQALACLNYYLTLQNPCLVRGMPANDYSWISVAVLFANAFDRTFDLNTTMASLVTSLHQSNFDFKRITCRRRQPLKRWSGKASGARAKWVSVDLHLEKCLGPQPLERRKRRSEPFMNQNLMLLDFRL